ncbi:fungal-specific transcription factor domain-containing protein [Aspergillus egyptiacus]|nr:fungal-specific transcription factor domain-containing protein [Aspergillus egyptiacus]
MSTPSLQQFANFSPFSNSQSARMTQSQTVGLDTLAEGSQYVLEQLQLSREGGSAETTSNSLRQSMSKSKSELFGDTISGSPSVRDSLAEARSAIRKSSSSAPVRRRISRACDQCNQLRTKCDGQNPCAHCIEFGLNCEYARERKKRGKASKKDLAAAAAAATAGQSSNTGTNRENLSPPDRPLEAARNGQTGNSQPPLGSAIDTLHLNHFSSLNLRSLQLLQNNPRSPPSVLPPHGLNAAYNDTAFSLLNSQEQNSTSLNHFRLGSSTENPSGQFLGLSPPAQSPAWLPLPSPSPANFPSFPMAPFSTSLRYPVLQPVLPHIASIIPQSLACDLLDLYFTSSSSSHLSPQSPYVVGYIFRKQSFLHPTKPRVCSPGLLASMLWVAAQTSDAPFLTSPPSARGRVCQKLLELTIGLLRPLIHGPALGEASPNYAANMVINGVALGGFGVSMDQLGAQSTATGAVDDVATYVHLATVVSASEYKAASMRWWTAAWTLARELKLGRELPPNTAQSGADGEREGDADGDPTKRNLSSMLSANGPGSSNVNVTEEEREERRRLWWLLYATDRHLALCYNRPLTLLDKECSQLLQPMNDDLWQAGEFPSATYRAVGPPIECSGHSMFGYFLPLMTILGGIIDLQQARQHPRYGLTFRSGTEWDQHTMEITQQLDAYGQSLKDFEARYTNSLALAENEPTENPHLDHVSPSGRSSSTVGSRVNESIVHTKMVVAYGTHIMHVLYILLAGKWDPINLLEDHDMWISSDSFLSAMSHAVGAAEAAAEILDYDPDLSFMPFFFGIYLLQGSFLLLLAADKLQGDANPSVVRACETIVRAHEACVVTLNTEYQRTFRKVMRSALAQVRGRVPDDFGEQQQRRREVLSLYRWTGDAQPRFLPYTPHRSLGIPPQYLLDDYTPRYQLLSSTEASKKRSQAYAHLSNCNLCPRKCGVNRFETTGVCLIGAETAKVNVIAPHRGEEPCIQGFHGSGSVFFSGCNLRCVFCQNHDISHQRNGFDLTPTELADWYMKLQTVGNVHNINLVTPEHVVPQVVLSILEARDMGLKIPIVYNTSSFDSLDSLKLLNGLVDIYLPDFKVWKASTSKRLLKADDYVETAMESVKAMHAQVGDLAFTSDGIAKRGVLLRHLVMPGKEDEGRSIMRWLAENVSRDLYVHIMEQYRPDAHVGKKRRVTGRRKEGAEAGQGTDGEGEKEEVRYADINRAVKEEEMGSVKAAAVEAGLWRFCEVNEKGMFHL